MIDEVKWQSSFMTGNSQMDLQHQHLFDVVNNMIAARNRGDYLYVMDRAIGELDKFTTQHMKDEEIIIKKLDLPKGKDHIKMHLDIVTKYEKFKHLVVNSEDESVVDDFIAFLKEWLVKHIGTEDLKLGL